LRNATKLIICWICYKGSKIIFEERGKINGKKTSGDIIRINITPKGKKSPSPPELWFFVHPNGIKKPGRKVDRTGPVQELLNRKEFEKEVGKIIVEDSKILSNWFEKK